MIRVLVFLCMNVPAFAADTLAWNRLPPIPDVLGVAAPFAGVSGGALFVAGGANFPDKMPWEGGKKMWLDRVWVLEKPDAAWREAGKLPRALGYGVSVTHGDSVVCFGGSDAERLPALPIPLANHCGAITSRHFLYVACGAEAPGELVASNRMFVLDLNPRLGKTWNERPPLPGKPRIFAAAAGLYSDLFIFGGVALEKQEAGVKRVYLRDAWKYNVSDGWKRLADAPKSIAAVPSPVPFVAGKFLFLAGDDGSRAGFQPVERHPGFPKTILAYDPALDRWSEAGEVPAPRATVPCVEWRGMFVVPGGEVRPGVRSPEVWTMTFPNP